MFTSQTAKKESEGWAWPLKKDFLTALWNHRIYGNLMSRVGVTKKILVFKAKILSVQFLKLN